MSDVGQTPLETVIARLDALHSNLAKMNQYIVDELGYNTRETFAELQGLTDFVVPLMTSTYNEVKNIGSNISEAIGDALEYVGDAFGSVGDTLRAAITEVGKIFDEVGSNIKAGLETAIHSIGSLFDNAADTIGSWIKAGLDIIDSTFRSVATGIKDSLDQSIKWVADKFGAFATWLADGFKELSSNVAQGLSSLGTAISDAVFLLVEWLKEQLSELIKVLYAIWDRFEEMVDQLFSMDEDFLVERATKMLNAQAKAFEKIKLATEG